MDQWLHKCWDWYMLHFRRLNGQLAVVLTHLLLLSRCPSWDFTSLPRVGSGRNFFVAQLFTQPRFLCISFSVNRLLKLVVKLVKRKLVFWVQFVLTPFEVLELARGMRHWDERFNRLLHKVFLDRIFRFVYWPNFIHDWVDWLFPLHRQHIHWCRSYLICRNCCVDGWFDWNFCWDSVLVASAFVVLL